MFAVVVTLSLKPGTGKDFLALVHDNAQASLRSEAGCHQFDVATDPARPDEVFLYEIYSDPAAFDAHLKTEHFLRFDAATAEMITQKDVRTYSELRQ
jgi:quinol monooxygenase YgiN